jgi:dihydrofolate reductase
MRTLVVTENITLDGSIEMLKDWFDAKKQGDPGNADLLEEQQRQGDEADALLVGRRTFEAFREYWPRQSDDTTGITDYLNQVQKYVVSSTLTDPAWANSTVLPGDPVEKVTALKHGEGKHIMLTGSITLAHTVIDAGLVDEYRLFVYPTVQGSGRRLFPEGYEISRLRLLGSKAFRSGVILQRYAPA